MRDYRRRNKVLWSIDRQYVEELAGQALTAEQEEALAEAIGNSSIPEALQEVIASVIRSTTEEATP